MHDVPASHRRSWSCVDNQARRATQDIYVSTYICILIYLYRITQSVLRSERAAARFVGVVVGRRSWQRVFSSVVVPSDIHVYFFVCKGRSQLQTPLTLILAGVGCSILVCLSCGTSVSTDFQWPLPNGLRRRTAAIPGSTVGHGDGETIGTARAADRSGAMATGTVAPLTMVTGAGVGTTAGAGAARTLDERETAAAGPLRRGTCTFSDTPVPRRPCPASTHETAVRCCFRNWS